MTKTGILKTKTPGEMLQLMKVALGEEKADMDKQESEQKEEGGGGAGEAPEPVFSFALSSQDDMELDSMAVDRLHLIASASGLPSMDPDQLQTVLLGNTGSDACSVTKSIQAVGNGFTRAYRQVTT